MSKTPALLADIGGTHARFAIGVDRQMVAPKIYRCADFSEPADAFRRYLGDLAGMVKPEALVVAVAAPVDGPRIAMTNHPWTVDLHALAEAVGARRVAAINDLAAIALALDRLAPFDLRRIGGDEPRPSVPRVVVGLGTGFGVAGALPTGDGIRAIASEGGHATLPARDAAEAGIVARLRERFDHVSTERVLCGPGLINLNEALAGAGQSEAMTPEQIVEAALEGRSPGCARTLDAFVGFLGGVLGNLVLTMNAWGGAYIAGGLGQALGDWLDRGGFRAAFEAKGRFAERLGLVPVMLIAHPTPALVGLDAWWREELASAQPAVVVDLS